MSKHEGDRIKTLGDERYLTLGTIQENNNNNKEHAQREPLPTCLRKRQTIIYRYKSFKMSQIVILSIFYQEKIKKN